MLIVRFSSLGDVVKCTHLPRLIKARYPAAEVTFLTSREFEPLLTGNPHLDHTIGFDRRLGAAGIFDLIKTLRRKRFDLVVDIHKSLRSRVICLFLQGRRAKYSKRTWQRHLLIQFGWNTYAPARGKEEDFLAGLVPHGIRDDGQGTELHVNSLEDDPDFRARFASDLKWFQEWRKNKRPILGIAPVAAWELKRWPRASFAEVAREFSRETGGAVVLFGGPEDTEVAALGKHLGSRALSLAGRTSFLESAYFAGMTDVVLSNDTGMAHLAEAVGADVIGLYGPTSRELGYYPVRPGSRALEIPLACRPCTRTGKGRCTHPLYKACLMGIPPEMVMENLRERFAGAPSSSVKPRLKMKPHKAAKKIQSETGKKADKKISGSRGKAAGAPS